MRALIYCNHNVPSWVAEYLPELHPALLPVAGKTVLEYFFDVCVLNGIKEVLLADTDFDSGVADLVGNGERWNLQIVQYGVPAGMTAETILKRQRKFFGDEPVAVFDGFYFPAYDRTREDGEWELPPLAEAAAADRMLCSGHGSVRLKPLEVKPLDTLIAYFEWNMTILRTDSGRYFLPGYNNEEGVFIGMYAEIMPHGVVVPPVILGDQIRIGRFTKIGPDVVIGNHVVVDNGTRIERALVLDHTYVGNELEISDKIVYRNHVIDPESGIAVQLTDNCLAAQIRTQSSGSALRRVLNWLVAALLLLLLALPFGLFWLLGARATRRTFYRRTLYDTRMYPYWIYGNDGGWRQTWLRRLSLDKVPLLWGVLGRRIDLTGNYAFPGLEDDAMLRRSYKNYRAGVFCLSELSGNFEPTAVVIDDLFLNHHRRWFSDVGLVMRVMFNRLFAGEQS